MVSNFNYLLAFFLAMAPHFGEQNLVVYIPLPIVTSYNRSVITALQDNYIGNTLVICRSRKSGIRHAWRCLVQLGENEGMIDVSMLVKHAEKGINSQGLIISSFDLADGFPPLIHVFTTVNFLKMR